MLLILTYLVSPTWNLFPSTLPASFLLRRSQSTASYLKKGLLKKNKCVFPCVGILIGWECKTLNFQRSPYSNWYFTESARSIASIKASIDHYLLEEDYSIERSSICSLRRNSKSPKPQNGACNIDTSRYSISHFSIIIGLNLSTKVFVKRQLKV